MRRGDKPAKAKAKRPDDGLADYQVAVEGGLDVGGGGGLPVVELHAPGGDRGDSRGVVDALPDVARPA